MDKLDKAKLDELISEILQEKQYVPKTKVGDKQWRDRTGFKNSAQSKVSKADFDSIRSLSGDGSFETSDLQAAAKVTDPNDSDYKTVRKFADPGNYKEKTKFSPQKAAKAAVDSEAAEQMAAKAAEPEGAADIDILATMDPITDATREAIVGFDLRNAQSDAGSFPPALRGVYEPLFKNEKTLIGRLRSMTEFTQNILAASKDPTKAQQIFGSSGFNEFALNVMAMDYVNSIAKGLDSASGAYAFESFLALISGGKVAGKEKTAAGQMGAADFTIGGTGGSAAKGSAKYYSDYSRIGQSSKGFDLGDNSVMHYIIGLKKDSTSAPAPDEGGTADPMKLQSIDLYYIIIQYVGNDPEKGNGVFVIRSPDKNRIGLEIAEGKGEIKINKKNYYTDQTKVGTLVLAQSSTKQYREMIQQAAGNISSNFGKAMEKVKETFDYNQTFKDSTSDYVADGGVTKGNAMITNLNSLLKGVNGMIDALKAFGGEYSAPTEKIKTSESKISDLDKLIMEVLQKNT